MILSAGLRLWGIVGRGRDGAALLLLGGESFILRPRLDCCDGVSRRLPLHTCPVVEIESCAREKRLLLWPC